MPLGSRRDFADARYAGIMIPFGSSIESSIQTAEAIGFDFVAVSLSDPQYRPKIQNKLADGSMVPPMLPETVIHTMVSGMISNQIVGCVSEWIDPDSDDVNFRALSISALKRELGWAGHLTSQACILPFPKHRFNNNYAQSVNSLLCAASLSTTLWLKVPVISPLEEESDSWEIWNRLRCHCAHAGRLGVVLEVGPELPEESSVERWWGEPVKAILLTFDCFANNNRGYPTLPKRHMQMVVAAFQMNIQIIFDGCPLWNGAFAAVEWPDLASNAPSTVPKHPPPPPPSSSAGAIKQQTALDPGLQKIRLYWEYMSYLFRKQPELPEDDVLEIPYRDFLQSPLQPLQDNLESQTYETFERDRIKYSVYQQAIYEALSDPETSFSYGKVVVMVVGAGRGPLVAATLSAAEAAQRHVEVFAVEKNPNAVVHLHARASRENWEERVKIVHADMRAWKPTLLADILVSELLGSFGDNELSPECLDGAQKFLKPSGISIPCQYTSYLSPITAHRVWTDIDSHDSLKQFETPFVVRLHRFSVIAPRKPVFVFSHPNHDEIIENERYATLSFKNNRPFGMVCHGFAGYFHATLYKEVHLSICPEMHTPGMHSWFPIYFPIRTPLYVPPNGEVQVSMWRRTDSTKVWYEWSLAKPTTTPIHNPNGRSYHVGL